jgi:ABC-type Fe3+-hydroxamate transport system substrate-binding protein
MLFVDQLDRSVSLGDWPPRRIVSLVPSQTELLHALGLDEEVVGITKFCVRPAEWFAQKPRVGGTKTVNLEKIAALQPDLIIANKEENERAQIDALVDAGYAVWISDVATLDDALDMIERVGRLTGRSPAADDLVARIRAAFAAQQTTLAPGPRPRVAYFIWRKPYMVAGGQTFINDMLDRAGLENVFADRPRYPEVSLTELQAANPAALLLSSEPYPFQEKHFPALREACPSAEVQLVDGELFSWYGSRLLEAPAYFARLHRLIE